MRSDTRACPFKPFIPFFKLLLDVHAQMFDVHAQIWSTATSSGQLGAQPGALKYGCVVAKLSEAIVTHSVGKVVVYVLVVYVLMVV